MKRPAPVPSSRRVSRSFRAGRVLIGLVWLNACHSWQPQRIQPTTNFGSSTRVNFARKDGTSIMLVGASIVADSVVGLRPGSWDHGAVALSEIQSAQAFRTSRTRTTLAVIGVVGGVVVIAGAIVGSVIALYSVPVY